MHLLGLGADRAAAVGSSMIRIFGVEVDTARTIATAQRCPPDSHPTTVDQAVIVDGTFDPFGGLAMTVA